MLPVYHVLPFIATSSVSVTLTITDFGLILMLYPTGAACGLTSMKKSLMK